MKRLWLLAVLIIIGCKTLQISDNAFVANSGAAQRYHMDRYKRLCPPVSSSLPAGPKGCKAMVDALKEWARLNALADSIKQSGALPAEQKTELRKLRKKVRRLP